MVNGRGNVQILRASRIHTPRHRRLRRTRECRVIDRNAIKKKRRPQRGRGLAARFQPDVIADQGHLDFRTPIEVEPLQSASGRTDLPFSSSVTVITPAP